MFILLLYMILSFDKSNTTDSFSLNVGDDVKGLEFIKQKNFR